MKRPDFGPLWRRFRQHGCPAARTALIEAHTYLVLKTRQRAYPLPPPAIAADDLESEGYLALVKAVDAYDPGRQVQFVSYAVSQIRFAMVEYLRREDWIGRAGRQAERRHLAAVHALYCRGEPVTNVTLAAELSLSPDEYDVFQGQASPPTLCSLEAIISRDDETALDPLLLLERLADPAPGPAAQFEAADRAERLWREVDGLEHQEPAVLRRYYQDDVTLKGIARELGRSESRSHQIHTLGIRRLRERNLAAVGIEP